MKMLSDRGVERNILILFNQQLSNKFISFSRKIAAKTPSKINLNLKDEFPHLTLYMTVYPERNIKKVIGTIAKIAKTTKPFGLKLYSKSSHPSGTIFIDAIASNELLNLHATLVEKLNPLREGLYNKDELNLPGISKKTIRSLEKYGMWAVKKDYLPHISIARVGDPKKEGPVALNCLPRKIDYEVLVQEIAFAERGHDGTCKKVIKRFALRDD